MLVEVKDHNGKEYKLNLSKEEVDSLLLEMHYDLTAQIEIYGTYRYIHKLTILEEENNNGTEIS